MGTVVAVVLVFVVLLVVVALTILERGELVMGDEPEEICRFFNGIVA